MKSKLEEGLRFLSWHRLPGHLAARVLIRVMGRSELMSSCTGQISQFNVWRLGAQEKNKAREDSALGAASQVGKPM